MRCLLSLVSASLAISALRAADSVYRDVNPDLLSSGLYAALEMPASPGPSTPERMRAVYPDQSKGRAPALLDPRVGPNLRLGDDPDVLPATQRGQVEPHIVRSMASPATLLATFQEGRYFDSGAISCGYAVSHDNGLTWRRALTPQLTTATGGRFNRATDPVAGAGLQGDLYLQALASAQGAFSLAAVVVSRSTDRGVTWNAPVVVFESNTTTVGPDKNWLAVNDYPGAPNSGRLVSTWTNFLRNAAGTTIASPLVASVSDDRGSTWSAPIEITAQGSNHQGTQPLFLPDGTLVVVYVSFVEPNNAARFGIQCKRSLDGGRTFPGAATTIVPLVNGWDDPQLRDGIFLPGATVARQSGALFVTYTENQNGTPRVMVTRSNDQGATWSAPVAASDQPTGISVMNPAITASPDGQVVTTVFTDKRNAPAGRDFVDHYAAISTDGGSTWHPNVRLSELSSDIRLGPTTARGVMLGDYLAIAPAPASGGACVAIWCETRTGDADPFVAAISPSSIGAFGSWAEVHRYPNELHGDSDGDGVLNYQEYLNGTNPTVPDAAQDLVIRDADNNTVEIAWTERRDGLRFNASFAGIAIGSLDIFEYNGAWSGTIAGGELIDGNYRGVSPGDGRVWHIARAPKTAAPQAFTKIYRFSAGLPARASSAIAVTGTDARLINVSTRGRIGPEARQMIVGFVLDGNKSILLRAAGPALASFGVNDAIADPRLNILGLASDLDRTNDNWQTAPAANAALFARLGAFPFASGSLDSALQLQLGAQSYTAIVSNANGAPGVALVEAYDSDPMPGATPNVRLFNLSTRGEAGPGDNALIAGFTLSGTAPRCVLLRAIGPGLANLGVAGSLADPVLAVFRGSTEIARNDDWQTAPNAAVVAVTAQQVGAFALAPGSLDAALLLLLAPGAYTAVLTGADGTTGIALVELYDVP